MQARTQSTHSDVWSQLGTTPDGLIQIGGRQSKKKRWNSDRRAICKTTCAIESGRVVIRHRGVSDGSHGAHPLWWSHSARTEIFFADVTDCIGGIMQCWGHLFCAEIEGRVEEYSNKKHRKVILSPYLDSLTLIPTTIIPVACTFGCRSVSESTWWLGFPIWHGIDGIFRCWHDM